MRRHAKAPSATIVGSAGTIRTCRVGFELVCLCVLGLMAFLGTGASAALAAEPSFTVDPVTTSSITTAKVTGTVTFDEEANGGAEGYWYFQYCEGACTEAGSWSYGPEAFSHTLPAGTTAEPVEETLTGLKASTEYTVRLAALPFNTFSEVHSEEAGYQTFTTDPATAPVLALDPPGTVSYTTAQLSGTIDPEGGNTDDVAGLLPISWELQVNKEGEGWNAIGSTSENPLEGSNAESTSPVAVTAEATGLAPNSAYQYRLLAHYAGLTAETEEADWGEFTTLAVTKPTITNLEASNLTPETAHFSAEVDPNGSDPAFDASWSFHCTPECQGLSGGTVSGGPEEVENDAIKLQPNTEYELTLTAGNLGGTEEKTTTFKTPAAAPAVRDFGAGHLGPEEATLHGEVNPRNSATVYWFEWGSADCSANPCQAIPATKDADAGSGGSFVYASEPLTGLSPATTYHFRLVAENAAGTTPGADREFTTTGAAPSGPCSNEARRVEQHSTYLPDCRAYEMVSPPDKNGGDVSSDNTNSRAAADGSAISYASLSGFADVAGTGVSTEYMAIRNGIPGTPGWSTHGITPVQEPLTFIGAGIGNTTAYFGDFSPDLSTGVLRAWTPLTDAPNVQNVVNLYLRNDLRAPGGGSYTLLTSSEAFQEQLAEPVPKPEFAAASSDFTHVTFASSLNLTSQAKGGDRKLYESVGGSAHLVGILPNGTVLTNAYPGADLASRRYDQRTISDDGSRIVFSTNATRQLYARINGEITIQLSRSERSEPESPSPATFDYASVDGDRVFFSSSENLVDEDDNTSGSEDLYMWKRAAGDEQQDLSVDASGGTFAVSLYGVSTGPIAFDATATTLESALAALPGVGGAGNVDVTGGPGGSEPYTISFDGDLAGVNIPQLSTESVDLTGGASAATVATSHPVKNLVLLSKNTATAGFGTARVLGSDDAGHYVYFSGRGQLVAGEPKNKPNAEEIEGLYLWHEGSISYLGAFSDLTFATSDMQRNSTLTFRNLKERKTSRVTPDGRFLLFMSHSGDGFVGHGGFEGADHGDSCTYDLDEPLPCRELYLYDAITGALRCASCPAGSPAQSDAVLSHKANSGAAQGTTHLSHALSDDGRYVFFATGDALVPQDTNGKLDVYEYDSATGSQHLITSGTESVDSYLMDASTSGRDVFVATRERLLGWDVDPNYDLYDVRVGGGLPEPQKGIAPCVAEACRSGTSGSPTLAAPATNAVSAPGNPRPKRCPAGRRLVLKHGKPRCLKKTKHHHRRAPKKHRRRAK